jgi:hypothetical protein
MVDACLAFVLIVRAIRRAIYPDEQATCSSGASEQLVGRSMTPA